MQAFEQKLHIASFEFCRNRIQLHLVSSAMAAPAWSQLSQRWLQRRHTALPSFVGRNTLVSLCCSNDHELNLSLPRDPKCDGYDCLLLGAAFSDATMVHSKSLHIKRCSGSCHHCEVVTRYICGVCRIFTCVRCLHAVGRNTLVCLCCFDHSDPDHKASVKWDKSMTQCVTPCQLGFADFLLSHICNVLDLSICAYCGCWTCNEYLLIMIDENWCSACYRRFVEDPRNICGSLRGL